MSTTAVMPRRLTALIVAVCTAGGAVLVAAAVEFATSTENGSRLLGLLALTAAATLAERFPVPISPEGGGVLSLTFVFAVAAIVLYGWAAGALLLLAATAIVQFAQHRPWERIAYNVSVLALVALAAGALISPIHGERTGSIVARVVIAATADNVVNVVLISAAMVLSSDQRYLPLLKTNTRNTIVPFAFMASAALMLVVLWERSPALSVALVGPLLAISLYQRSTHRALRAMRLALTDPLTGLGNHRHFHERLREEVQDARRDGRRLTLCLVDIDDFKLVNDRFGHPAGDRVLAEIATRLRQGGESFRLGGDEFAVLLPGASEESARRTATSIVERIAALELDVIGSVTVSAGVAVADPARPDQGDLIRRADGALYTAKQNGKNAVGPSAPRSAPARSAASGSSR